jgi:hypothetical protein
MASTTAHNVMTHDLILIVRYRTLVISPYRICDIGPLMKP